MFKRTYLLILGILFLAVASVWAAEPKRNLAVAPGTPAAVSEARVALVIGNSNYKSAPLKNPVNDAKAIADKLQGLGFKVTLKLDQDQMSMADAIRIFGNQLKGGGAGLFYYAGHGMQVRGRNFLIPVDANIQNEDEVPYRSVDANEVLSKMETAKNRLNLMILDACRNNPFARKFRSAAQGLAQMDAPSGTLVAFATAPGSVASDGTGKNGIYTQHLLASLGQPGVPVEQFFKRVRVGVMKDTRNTQVPWESSSLVGDFYFKPSTASATADPAAIELAYWDGIKDSSDTDDYKAYLKKYPNGQFADLAKRRTLNPLKPATTAVASIALVQLSLTVPGKTIELSPDDWVKAKDEANFANNYEERKMSPWHKYGRMVTVFSIPMSDDRRIGLKISDREYVEFFIVLPGFVTAQTRVDKDKYWVFCRETFNLKGRSPIDVSVYKPFLSENENRQLRQLYQAEVDETRHLLNSKF